MNLTQKELEKTLELQKRLKKKGDSLRGFAHRHHFNYRTVCIVAQRWWHRRDKMPHGGISRAILEKMVAEFGHD